MLITRFRLLAMLSVLLVAAATPACAKDDRQARPALWKVADEDTTIWLFGTIHALPRAVEWDRGPVAKALDTADELVTEVPMDDAARSHDVIMQLSLRDDGKSLRDTLPAEGRRKYEEALARLGLPATVFDHNDAWFAALMLSLLPLKAAGYDTANGIDTQIASHAKAHGTINTALETVDYQIGLFENLPPTAQEGYLAEVVKALPTMAHDLDAMVQAWKEGDAERLARLMNEDESDPAIRKALLTDRNEHWAKWLKERLKRPGTAFVAVGAGHLAGPGSVQEKLVTAGVGVKRVQ